MCNYNFFDEKTELGILTTVEVVELKFSCLKQTLINTKKINYIAPFWKSK